MPMRFPSPLMAALGLFGVLASASAATLDGIAVDVTNRSEPVLCAEKDNVTVEFASPEVRGFRIEANHPTYIGGLRRVEPSLWRTCAKASAACNSVLAT